MTKHNSVSPTKSFPTVIRSFAVVPLRIKHRENLSLFQIEQYQFFLVFFHRQNYWFLWNKKIIQLLLQKLSPYMKPVYNTVAIKHLFDYKLLNSCMFSKLLKIKYLFHTSIFIYLYLNFLSV